jgi:glycerol-3-phosphate dehydrogenase
MYDLIVIGGGINGCGIARDAAGRGLKVLLVEKDDLAGATSSASTKLIHGGLRYLEQYDFKLVAESLNERERLLRSASHIIWPLEFILPHEKHVRPYWMIRLGLYLYDFLGKRTLLPASKGVNFNTHPAGKPLKKIYKKGVSYADCWADDARLVVLNAIDAAIKGAAILPRTECVALKPDNDVWHVTLENKTNGAKKTLAAKCVVNATGPWVRSLLDANGLAKGETYKIRHSRGSHIIVPRLYDGEQAYILQQEDKRIVFAIPYEQKFTLIGTTDALYDGDPACAEISEDEKRYLCNAVNRSFEKQITVDDIVWHYSGVRPLLDSGDKNLSKVTRDYKLDLETSFGPPLLNVFGGKLTTFRKLSEQAVDQIVSFFPEARSAWTRDAILPGGEISAADFELFFQELKMRYDWADEKMLRRYARAYGTISFQILGRAHAESDLGTHYGDDVYEAEIRYLIEQEWAETLEDILWRRSKLGLHISLSTKEALEKAIPAIVKDVINDTRPSDTGT